MARKDRIMAKPMGSSALFSSFGKDEMVLVYRPMKKENGDFIYDASGGILVESVGGVKAGSKGTVIGPSIKVPKKMLTEYKDMPTPMGVDMVDLFPVTFDNYATGVAFLVSDCIKMI